MRKKKTENADAGEVDGSTSLPASVHFPCTLFQQFKSLFFSPTKQTVLKGGGKRADVL